MNKYLYKIPIDGQQLKNKIHSKGYSIRELGSEVSKSEKTILRAIHDNEIAPSLLEEISNHIGISKYELTGLEDNSFANTVDDFVKRSLDMTGVSWRKYMGLDGQNKKLFDSELVGAVCSVVKKYF